MKEKKVGKRFVTGKGVVLEVQLASLGEKCDACYYHDKRKCDKVKCLPEQRKDNQEVIFRNITETFTDSDQLLIDRGVLDPNNV